MSSLRSRQFLSALAIIFLGIILLGSVLYYVTQHKMLKDEESSLSESGLELMGFLDFKEGKFGIDTNSKNDFLAFLIKNEFSKLGCTYSVYSDNSYTVVEMNGIEKNFDKALHLLLKHLIK